MDEFEERREVATGVVARLVFRFGDETYAILGACFAVYREKGCGFLEAVYQECLEIEMTARGIPFLAQSNIQIAYRGKVLRQPYVADFVCFDNVLVEIKAVRKLAPEHRAQIMNYMRATGIEVGLLVNFGHYPQCEHERIIVTAGRFQTSVISAERSDDEPG